MNTTFRKNALTGIKLLVSLAFVAAGLAKLAGAEMMVATYDAIGFGQWFRYVTGIIEIGGAALLWLPGKQIFGAALLTATMVGAVLSHIIWLGTDTMIPALILGLLSGIIAYSYRDQLTPG